MSAIGDCFTNGGLIVISNFSIVAGFSFRLQCHNGAFQQWGGQADADFSLFSCGLYIGQQSSVIGAVVIVGIITHVGIV